jgi:(p)ppGpp synthase/HD superfamily hydrolase
VKREDQRKLADALVFALEKHGTQTRKGKAQVPYVSHLLAVSGYVLEHGSGDLDLAIAGLLHDVLEDCEGVTEGELRERFGDEVARIVRSCTDTLPGDTPQQKSPWRDRKERYLANLARKDRAAQIVSACDKLHNLQNIVADMRAEGPGFLARFNASPGDLLWYYRGILSALRTDLPAPLLGELDALVRAFEGLAEEAAG